MKSERTTIKNRKLLIAITLFLFLTATSAQATLVPCGTIDDPKTPINESQPCQLCHLFVLLDTLIKYFLTYIVPTVATGLVAWAGFKMVTAKDNRKSYEDAKNIITAVVIGIVIISASWVLLDTFLTAIGIAEWTGLGNWWQIKCP
jgi:hypothetical protein